LGVGHAAVALGAARLAPRVNLAWLVFAAFLADFLLGVFAALGLEHAHVPPDYASRHYLTFTFPWSHGLVPLLVWGALLGWLVSRLQGPDRSRVFLVVGALVVSHFALDGLVHVTGLPLLGESSPKIGLGLWKDMPLELAIETLLTLACVVLYLRFIGSRAPAAARFGIPVLMLLLTVATWSPLWATVPPSPSQLIPGWIGMPVLFSLLVFALDRGRVREARQ
jgi:hypothetical protein